MSSGCGLFLAFLMSVGALIVALSAIASARNVERQLSDLRTLLDSLERRLAAFQARRHDDEPTLEKPMARAAATATPPPSPAPEHEAPPPTVEAPLPEVDVVTAAKEIVFVEEQSTAEITTAETQPAVSEPAFVPPPPARPVAPPPPPPPPRPAPAPSKAFDWEGLVGVKLFSWIAGIALVLAAIFFLRYSVQQGWLSPVVRAAIGLIAGSTLIAVCELRIARGYAMTANAMHGAGIAILYATLFATHALWHILPPGIVFPLMIVVTAVAVMLSIRRDSVFIALLGLVGGFATPALLSSGENRPVALFGYLLLLNVGLAFVGYRKRWPALTAFSMLFTVLYEWGWIAKFLTPSQMPLAVAIFLVFAVVSTTALWMGRGRDAQQSEFDRVAALASALPLLFAFFGAAVPEYGAHTNLLFGFLLLMAAGLGAIAFTRGPRWLHELGGGTVLIVFAIWFSRSYTASAWPGVLAWIVVFVALYLAFEVRFRSTAVYAAPLLFLAIGTLIALGATGGSALLIFGVTFVLLGAAAAVALWRERGLVYTLAAFFTIVAEAIWSAKYLDRGRLLTALAIYGVFALFFLGVPLIAARLQKRLEPRGALAVLLLVSIALLLFLTGGTVADTALWGMAVLLAILNLGALVEARDSSHPLLAATAMILSWIVIAVWWGRASIDSALLPALFVVGAFSVLVVAGNVWASRSSADATEFENSVYLAIVGHVFLMFVATQKALAIPPWPLLAILFLLDLALGTAALYVKRARLLTAALGASQVVLFILAFTATSGGWPVVDLIACIAVSALGVAWFAIDRRFAESATTALVGAYVVAIAAGSSAEPRMYGALLAAHAAITIALLAVAWVAEEHVLACVAALAVGAATALAQTKTPSELFWFGCLLFAIVIAYPLLLGGRAKRSIEPYLAAVLASAWFFFTARSAMVDAKLDWMIGILPVGEAIVLMILLVRLLQIEAPGRRELSRLALVAGAALAFITAAVPLQLEKQWITIAWALEGAALVWLFTRIPHRGLLLWAAGLLTAVFVRLSLNPAVLTYHAPSHVAVLNWFLYSYLVCGAAMFVAAWLAPREHVYARAAAYSGGTILLFLLVNIEIADFYSRGPTLTFNFFSSSLAQDLTYTIAWAIFAIAMLVAGISSATRSTRVAALVLLLATILKCFLHDLARLGGLYRVGSLLGLAVSLVITGLLLQKFIMPRPKGEVPAP